MDQELFDECKRRFEDEEAKADALKEKREAIWKCLEAVAAESLHNKTK